MISCSLQGAIGNQMFQIAATYALAKRHGFECGFDLASYTPLQGFQGTKYADTVFRHVPKKYNHEFKYFYTEPSHAYAPIPGQDDMLIINSYLQSEKYFQDFEDDIRRLFDVPILAGYESLTSIHVRRGDFLAAPHVFPICSLDYYREAMEMIGGDFVVCSDDIAWCRENFKGENIHFSPFFSEESDLALMKSCKNNIIANSTFSWWGAWLNPNPDKIVVAPKKWFQDGGPDASDIVPEYWNRI